MRGLTDAKVKTAKPANKPYKLADSGWLYLMVMPRGSKLWRMPDHVGCQDRCE